MSNDRVIRVAITGGRRHRVTDAELSEFLDIVHSLMDAAGISEYERVTLSHGAAAGVDRYIAVICKRMGMVVVPYRVDVELDGPYPDAPKARNGRMLDESRAEVLIAFRGGGGTADCARKAARRGIEVRYAYTK